MNCGTFKFFQRHVIAHNNVLVGHSLLEPFPSKIFILKKIHRSAFSRRFIGVLLGGLDEVVSAGLDRVVSARMDESRSRICAGGSLKKAGGTTKPGLTTPDLDDPCFAFLWPRRLGRLPKSIILDKDCLLSPVARQG